MTTLYKTQATALAGRNGLVKTDDGLLELELAYPKEMGGTGAATNQNNCLQQVTQPVFQMLFCMWPAKAKWL